MFSALLILGGALGDKFGARAVFVAGVLIFTVPSRGCCMAPSNPVLIAMRGLQGAAMLLPMSLTGYLALARVNTPNATWWLDGALILAGVGWAASSAWPCSAR
jgi:MFS family permease